MTKPTFMPDELKRAIYTRSGILLRAEARGNRKG